MSLTLKPFDKQQAKIVEPWFDDSDTRRRLGDRSWLDNVLRLLKEPPGTEFRGEHRISFHAFVAYDGDEPVGYVDGGITDRWVHYGGESDEGPIYLDTDEKISAGITFATNPIHRKKGYAEVMIRALIQRSEFKEVKIFGAGVEPDNIGSIKALEAAGFKSDYKPDFEDMLYFFYRR
jgi:RimJ/RimL family protein N-acetyltransferase